MSQLNFPPYTFKIKVEKGKKYIFDKIRKKYVALQPEEIVRQNMIEFLIQEKGYPELYIGNEISMTLNNMQKRCDSVIYNKFGKPIMIIEYKAPHIEITQAVFDQIAVYNMKLGVNYLLISNGMQHICCKVNAKSCIFLSEIPLYKDLE